LWVAVASWVAVAAWLLAGPYGAVLDWDEVDYLNAARMGLTANALDSGGLGYGGLSEMIRAKYRGAAPSLPDGYDEVSDPVVVRHYHPPGMVYPHLPVALAEGERASRAPLLVGLLLFTALFSLTAGRISSPPSPWGWGLVGLAGAWLGLLGFTRIHGHGWLAAWTLAVAFGLATWRSRGWSRGRGLTLAALVLSGLTLESAAILWGAAAAFLLRDGRRLGIPRRDVAITFAGAAAGVVLLWPGVLVNGSPLHIAALYGYRIVWGEEYSALGARLLASVLPYLPAVALAALALGTRWTKAGEGEPHSPAAVSSSGDPRLRRALLVVGAAYGAPMLLVSMGPTYLLPAVGPAVLVALACILRRGGRAAAGAAAVFAFLVVGSVLRPTGAPTDARARDDLAAIASAGASRGVWADGGHIVRWYFPNLRVTDLTVSWDGRTLTRRVDGAYVPVGAEQLRGTLVVIVSRRDAHPHRPAALQGCRRTPLNTVSLFDC
jgi:hypothetical protein